MATVAQPTRKPSSFETFLYFIYLFITLEAAKKHMQSNIKPDTLLQSTNRNTTHTTNQTQKKTEKTLKQKAKTSSTYIRHRIRTTPSPAA